MIEIIKNTMEEPIEIECPECYSILNYNYQDIQRKIKISIFGNTVTDRVIVCPVCKNDIYLDAIELKEERHEETEAHS